MILLSREFLWGLEHMSSMILNINWWLQHQIALTCSIKASPIMKGYSTIENVHYPLLAEPMMWATPKQLPKSFPCFWQVFLPILSEVSNVPLKFISLHHKRKVLEHWVQLVMVFSRSELSHSHAFLFRKKGKVASLTYSLLMLCCLIMSHNLNNLLKSTMRSLWKALLNWLLSIIWRNPRLKSKVTP